MKLDRNEERIKRKIQGVKIITFYAVMFVFAIVALIIPLRPTKSEVEKRDLATFPEFSAEGFLNGEYFAEIDNWYTDTFPFRDLFLKGNTFVASLNGIQTVKIQGEVIQADDIPEFEERTEEDIAAQTDEMEEPTSEEISSEPPSSVEQPTQSFVPEELDDPTDAPISVETQTMGPIFIAGDSAYEYYGFNQAASDGYVNVINTAAEKLSGMATVYDIIIPNSMDIALNDSIRSSINTSNQNNAINYMYSKMSSRVKVVPIFKTLRDHKKEYLYFRTDHHWTATGAYYAYLKFAEVKGMAPASLDQFDVVEFNGFLGSFYGESGQSSALSANPDTVVAYVPKSTNSMQFTDRSGQTLAWNIVYDVSGWNASSKYNTFIGGDNPISVIKNPNINDNSAVVVVKESYGNAFVPFLVENYQTVVVVDYRYCKDTLNSVVANYGAKDVIFINNVVATGTPARIENLNYLIR